VSASIWTTRRALVAHIALLIWVPGCAIATWWQVSIALSGDDLGWAYSIMWPFFAVFGTIFWWNLVHDDPETLGARGLRRLHPGETGDADLGALDGLALEDAIKRAEEEDPELAKYNAYLAELARSDDVKSRNRR
jgi:hypothetical protein